VSGQLHAPASFHPWKEKPFRIGWAPRGDENIISPARNQTPVDQPSPSHYID